MYRWNYTQISKTQRYRSNVIALTLSESVVDKSCGGSGENL